MSDEAERWRELNRANWDERTKVHLGPGSDYDLASLRSGHGRLHPIEDAELGDVSGRRALHLQCHFGVDTLKLAQRGASVVGLDFSPAAIEAANKLAIELGLAGSARFVLADLYDAPSAIPEPQSFYLVFTTWGATCWLPDIRRWAAIVASFLKPSGRLYYADAHPAAYVFDDDAKLMDGPDTSCRISGDNRWSWSTTGTTPIHRPVLRTPPTSSGCIRCPTLSAA